MTLHEKILAGHVDYTSRFGNIFVRYGLTKTYEEKYGDYTLYFICSEDGAKKWGNHAEVTREFLQETYFYEYAKSEAKKYAERYEKLPERWSINKRAAPDGGTQPVLIG
jgi:hypothetical protein